MITIQKSSSGAYFTINDSAEGISRPYLVNDYDFVPLGDNIHFSLLDKFRRINIPLHMSGHAASEQSASAIIDNQPYTNITNGDTSLVFADFATLQTYILTNFFRKAGGGSGSGANFSTGTWTGDGSSGNPYTLAIDSSPTSSSNFPVTSGGVFTSLAAKLSNPATTTGDLIYSSSGSTLSRLGIGSSGKVLTVAGGVPSWATASSGGVLYGVAAGTDTYTATIGTIGAYTTGDTYNISFTNSNTSTTPTININGIGAIQISRITGNTMVAGDILAGQIVQLVYTGTVFTAIQLPYNVYIRNGAAAQTGGFNLTGNSTITGQLTFPSAASFINLAAGGYIQMTVGGGGTWFLDNESENSIFGATFSKSGQPPFKFTDNGVLQRHIGAVVYNTPWGVSANKTAQTTTQTVQTFLTTYAGLYSVSIAADVTSVSGGSVTLSFTYSDINSNTQTVTLTALTTVTASQFQSINIWAKAGSTVTITATVAGTVTYDAISTVTHK